MLALLPLLMFFCGRRFHAYHVTIHCVLVYYQESEVAAQPCLRGAIQAGVPLPRPGGEAQREQGVSLCY